MYCLLYDYKKLNNSVTTNINIIKGLIMSLALDMIRKMFSVIIKAFCKINKSK